MHSVLNRGNQLLSFGFSVTAVAVILCALESVTRDYTTDVSLKTGRVSVRNVDGNGRGEPEMAESRNLGIVSFDMKVNFSSVFNWNVRQLFVYLTAEYPSTEFDFNQQVIWDRIIKREDDQVVDLKEFRSKYYFWDAAELSRSHENVSLCLSWNVIPASGFIKDFAAPVKHVFKFPKAYDKFQKPVFGA